MRGCETEGKSLPVSCAITPLENESGSGVSIVADKGKFIFNLRTPALRAESESTGLDAPPVPQLIPAFNQLR